ncbi:unnamed protein product, partial [marine sediment metagenome]
MSRKDVGNQDDEHRPMTLGAIPGAPETVVLAEPVIKVD